MPTDLDAIWCTATPQVVSVLARRYGDFDAAEDAVQEALLVAAQRWPADGVPDTPVAWLTTTATRRLVDAWRSDAARARREEREFHEPPAQSAPSADDSLTLVLLCCHPSLTRTAQVPLTLRAVGGLSTAQIGRLLLSPEATVAQRISRAKATLRAAGATFAPVPARELPQRLAAVQQVLYLVFTEGHVPSSADATTDVSASAEAIRLTRMLRASCPDDGETAGLLALMLLTDARRTARDGADVVPLADQDRSLWDRSMIAEGVALLEQALPRSTPGPYQLQAAIAAVHAEADSVATTDWQQIAELYRLLAGITPSPVVALNRAVAVAMVDGPRAGLDLIADIEAPVSARWHRVHAVRAHLLQEAGDLESAKAAYQRAWELATNTAEKRYLEKTAHQR